MSHWVTERCGLSPAPAGLAIIQDLLNTRKIGSHGNDLLDSVELAATWLPDVLQAWAADTAQAEPELDWLERLTERDLVGLRTLRSDIERLLHDDAAASPERVGRELVKAAVQLSPTGRLRLVPTGSGWHWLAAAVGTEAFLAQQNGSWQRLKTCRNPVCGSAFFDRSKNNSGVWHDVKVCGNAANLRASRARKRALPSHRRPDADLPGPSTASS